MFINQKPSSVHLPIELNPQGFKDIYGPAMKDFREFHASYSQMLFDKRVWDDTLNEIHEKDPNANIPNPFKFRPDLNLTDEEQLQKMFDGVNWGASGAGPIAFAAPNLNDLSPQKKEKFVRDKIKSWLNTLPPDERNTYKGYDHWFEQRAKDVRDSQNELAFKLSYSSGETTLGIQDSTWGNLAGSFFGGMTDPLVLGMLPYSFTYAAGGTFATQLIRAAAFESLIGGVTVAGIETQVVPFKQSVGIDYDWADAAKVIGLGAAAGGVLAPSTIAVGKGISTGYAKIKNNINQLSPELRNKFIGKEFDKLVKNPDPQSIIKFNEYIQKNIDNLKESEITQIIETLNPNGIKSPALKFELEQIQTKNENIIDNPYENNVSGTLEHIERQDAAAKALALDQQPKTPVESSEPIVIKEKRDVIYHEYLKPEEITIDADQFQFKTGGDAQGVLNTLRGVKQWRRESSGVISIWENAAGKKFLVDGHQRVGLAKRLQKKNPKEEIILTAQVSREVDGWTPQDVYMEALTTNLHNGSASASDLAIGLRQRPDIVNEILQTVSPYSATWRKTNGLTKLSDEAWGYFLNSKINDKLAALVGEIVDDPALHASVLRILEKINPKSEIEIRTIIAGALDAGNRNAKTIDMFGETTIKESLFVERGKVLKAALVKLKNDKKLMSTLVQNEQKIIESGKNKLDTTYNRTLEEQNEAAIYQIETLANRKGSVSESLKRSAKIYAEGNKQKAINSFIESVRDAIDRGDYQGIDQIRTGRIEQFTDASFTISEKQEPSIAQKNFDNFDDPNNLRQAERNVDQEFRDLESELLMESKTLESLTGGDPNTSPTVRSEYSTQVDEGLFQTTGIEPPESVFAKATDATPLSRIDEVSSIGSFKGMVDKPILQKLTNADELLAQAKKYEPSFKATLDNISKNIEKSSVEVRVKEKDSLQAKFALSKVAGNDEIHPSYISDYLGGRIIVDNLDDVKLVYRALDEQGIKMVAVENYFKNPHPSDSGYVALHTHLVTKDGFSMELQIHHKDMKKVFEEGTAYRKYKHKHQLTKEEELDKEKLAAQDKIVFDKTFKEIKEREGFIDDLLDEEITLPFDEMVSDGEIINGTTTLRALEAEIANDKAIVKRLKECAE